MKTLTQMCMDEASGAFLCKPIPANWATMTKEDRSEWVSTYRFDSFISLKPEELFNRIQGHARSLEYKVSQLIQNAENRLVDAAADDQLPQDFRELNLRSIMQIQ